MAKINEFNGNDYIRYVIDENQINPQEMTKMIQFCDKHKNIYLFGKGVCGKGFEKYTERAGFNNIKGFLTSDSIDAFAYSYEEGKDGIILTLKSDYYDEILPKLISIVNINDILFLKEKTKKKFMLPFSREYIKDNFWITLVVTKHCNINCASCNMFAPLCKQAFYSLESVKNDIKHIKRLNMPLKKINITGGEPFLNPEMISILLFLKQELPETKIEVYTNGILLSRLSDSEWEDISNSEAEFHVTEYGIKPDILSMIYNKFNLFNIPYVLNAKDENKVFFKKRVCFKGDVASYEYINCQFYSFCYAVYLFDGKAYKCPLGLNSEDINSNSEDKIELCEADYIELSKMNSCDDIYDYWESRLPLCRYCPTVTYDDVVEWKRSERKIEEWM